MEEMEAYTLVIYSLYKINDLCCTRYLGSRKPLHLLSTKVHNVLLHVADGARYM